MLDLNRIPRNYDEAVQILAAWHGDDSTESIAIYLIPDPAQHTIRFVEVSKAFSTVDTLRPISMGASSDFPFPTSVLLVSESDWQLVQNSLKALPHEWDLSTLTLVWPHG